MFVAPGTTPNLAYKATRAVAEQVARNSWVLLVNGALLIVAGVLIFSINWTTRELATFIGVLFIVQGVADALTTGFDALVRRANIITGLLSIAAGVAIIVWPGPGLLAVAIFLGAWLIVTGTLAATGSFATRKLWSDWWLLLVLGVLEIALGVLALANPGATLAALITVAGIWAIAVGVMRIVLGFELRYLPGEMDRAYAASQDTTTTLNGEGTPPRVAATQN
jgi:uncharacterized membrane protein HdeD (DUF308 family)